MSENYRPEEKSRYSEIYRPNEYNRSEERSCAVENFVSEEFRTRTESAKPSNGNKGKSDKLKKSLLGSGIITAVGTVAGAAVIVAAVVLTAVLEITVKSFTATSGSLFIKLEIENTANTVLTAVLSSEEEVYSRTIEKGVGSSELYFYLLEPDTEYLLEVKGDDGQVCYSGSYRTRKYVQKLFTEEEKVKGKVLFLRFAESDLWKDDLEVYFDGALKENALNASMNIIAAEDLTANAFCEVKVVDPTDGEILFLRNLDTGNYLDYRTEHINALSAKFSFDAELFPDVPLKVYLDGELLESELTEESDVLTLEGLRAETDYLLEVKVSATEETLLKVPFTTNDVVIEEDGKEISQQRMEVYYNVLNSSKTAFTIELERDGAVSDSSAAEINADSQRIRAVFDACEPNVDYTVRVRRAGDEVAIYSEEIRTASFFNFVTAVSAVTDGERTVHVLERREDNEVNYAEILYYGESGSSSEYVVCESENGYSLPVETYYDEGAFVNRCDIFTDFALAGEIYTLTLHTVDSSGVDTVLEKARIVIDGGEPSVYPEFDIKLSFDGENGAIFEITVLDADKLPAGENIFYSATQLESSETVSTTLENFLAVPSQSVPCNYVSSQTEYSVRLFVVIKDRAYGIATRTFFLETSVTR